MGTLFGDLASQFHQSFIEADRWQRYLSGIGVSFTVTLGALIIGVILGVLVAVVRTLHDQQKSTEGVMKYPKTLSFLSGNRNFAELVNRLYAPKSELYG